MALYVMAHDTEGGGSNYLIVSAETEALAYDCVASLDVENIGCILSNPTTQELEDFLHEQYESMATLSTTGL